MEPLAGSFLPLNTLESRNLGSFGCGRKDPQNIAEPPAFHISCAFHIETKHNSMILQEPTDD